MIARVKNKQKCVFMLKYRTLRILTLFALTGLVYMIICGTAFAVAVNADKAFPYSVKWVGAFSGSKDFKQKEGFFSGILKLITGSDAFTLKRPVAVWNSPDGNLRVLDQELQSLLLIRQNDRDIKSASSFPSLVSMCMTKSGVLYFTDSKRNGVFIQETPDKTPHLFNKNVSLNRPTGIAFLEQKQEIWVVETGAHRIAILDSKGKFLRYIGKRGISAGEFNFPTFIWIDTSGTVYIVDSMNFRAQILSSSGLVLTVFGEAGDASGYFARPKGIATDTFGHIYIADALFHTVQVFDQKGNYLYHFGEQGSAKGKFWMPMGIFIGEDDRIFVADSYNHRIQIFKIQQRESNDG